MITQRDFGLANGPEMHHQYSLEGEKNLQKSPTRVGKTKKMILWYLDLVPDTSVMALVLREAKVAGIVGGPEMGMVVLLSLRHLTLCMVERGTPMLIVVMISSLVSHPHPGKIPMLHRSNQKRTWHRMNGVNLEQATVRVDGALGKALEVDIN
jgi:hypothetical protein